MNVDIHRLLEETADDTDRPMGFSPEDLTRRGERSTWYRRAGVVTAAVVGTTAVVAAVAALLPSPAAEVQPAGTSEQKFTLDPQTGKTIQPGPAQSPVSDDQIIARCLPLDDWFRNANHLQDSIQGWTVLLKQGSGAEFDALLVPPDHKQVAHCAPGRTGPGGRPFYSRRAVRPAPDDLALWMTGGVPATARLIVMETPDGKVSEVPMKDGFWLRPDSATVPAGTLFRVYDGNGKVLLDFRQPGVKTIPVR
ncbi:hypothetical protein AB0E69_06320 [Kribbella sp. NPDC026611]|uniref:hypothetical protein n=1 Tax=Kribbella sp. NPDC026611 TaxID=3154911 RepID=UPI0033EC450F